MVRVTGSDSRNGFVLLGIWSQIEMFEDSLRRLKKIVSSVTIL
jgi:hypothetical protein